VQEEGGSNEQMKVRKSEEDYHNQSNTSGFMRVVEFLLEYIALFDFITDVIVTIQLFTSKNTGWALMTVGSMLAPLYVSSIQITQFLLDRVLRRDKSKNNLALITISWVSIFPLFMVFMFIMDQVFVINSTLFELFALLLGLTSCLNCIDGSYEFLFQMKKHEVSGFRRMRTITQLMFESIIQFAVQFWMLSDLESSEDAEGFGVSKTSILTSLALAIGHMVLEGIQLYFEASACETSFVNYCVICFNGRFGWVPFLDKMNEKAQRQKKFEKENEAGPLMIADQKYGKTGELAEGETLGEPLESFVLNYAKVQKPIGCMQVSIPFKFSDASISSFCQTVADLPSMKNR
jgi:hypothetical protein